MTYMTAFAVVLATFALPSTSSAQGTPQQPEPQPVHDHAPARGDETQVDDHAAHELPAPRGELPPHIPPLTDADRAAAFPDLQGHTLHGESINYFLLFDQLEWQGTTAASGLSWENKGWVGGDRDRFWFRSEGEGDDGKLAAAHAHAFYGRAIAPWWDVVVGIRQDVRPGSPQTWAAVGLQGLAPYWFEVEATAYVGASGRTHFRVETEYEALVTNRLILQPLVEAEVYGKSDPDRGIGAGLSATELGLRLRYEIRREFAPYVGVVWHRKFFGTADHARAAGESTGGARLAAGLRLWL
jgi:copper resistance protein B